MITKSSSVSMASVMAQMSPEAQIAMNAIDQTHESRKAAKLGRDAANQDRLDMMRKSANKLRDMADKALCSSIYQGVIASVRAGANIAGQWCDPKGSAVKKLDNLDKGSAPLAAVDPFKLSSERDGYEKALIDIQAEAASQRSTREGDEVSRTSQSASALTSTLDRILDIRRQTDMGVSK